MTRVDLRDARRPEQRHAALDFGAQQAKAAPHTGMTAGRESVQVGAPDRARVRTQRERLDDVRAATDPTVDDQLECITDRVANGPDAIDGRRRRVELPATVVRRS